MKKILLSLALVFSGTFLFAQQTYPVNGSHDIRQGTYAFINANIVVNANQIISNGTLLIKGQNIESVGSGLKVPKGFVIFDLKGKFIYPSLIDAFTSYGLPEITRSGAGRQSIFISTKKGAYNWNEAIKPETHANTFFAADVKKANELRKAGFGSVNAINRDGIARGTSAAVTLNDEKENSTILNPQSAANYSFSKGSSQNDYPTSLMGAIALLRQTYYDVQWYNKQKEEYNISLEELNKQQGIPQIFEADGWQNILRAAKIGKEFNKHYIIKSNGDEYQRIDAVKATGASLIIPVNFVPPYDVDDTIENRNITIAQMKAWELAPTNPGALEKAGVRFSITTHGLDNIKDFWTNLRLAIENGLTEKQALLSLTEIPANMIGIAGKAGTIEKGKLANFIITSDSLFKAQNVIEENWVQGKRYILSRKESESSKDSISKVAIRKNIVEKRENPGLLMYPFVAFGNTTPLKQESVLIKNATVWTNEKEGILPNTDVLLENGKIKAIGKNLNAGNAKVIDAAGKHVTPGIIDEHSHIAGTGGINEGAQSVSSEVRIADVINSEDINIYRQLAGGVTTSQILHGSANPIGGQSQLIKLRWGKLPEELKFEGADGFIKFALGENVKQSNFGTGARFPVTRMGVEQTFVDEFTRAKEYKAAMAKKGNIVRRDLELDALVEILENKRFITCHSYVQSEINMLMHVADSLGFKINTFTHILEGYKVADKMKSRGINASTFSDWWAYKMEVAEAIPYNGKIMHNVGITTAFNSDDAEMARRLNQEAGKAVLYGGVPEEEAFKFVTLNPAKMLHIDNKVGSLKVGKDADVVIWSDNPLSIYAKAEQTFVDGIPYWDINRDDQIRRAQSSERSRLIKKMGESKQKGGKTQRPKAAPPHIYHCETMEDYSLELSEMERNYNHE